jgi:hypothetical protein
MATAAYIVAVVVVAALLPPINEVPSDLPAVVLWHFRVDSLALTERRFIADGVYRPRLSPALTWRYVTARHPG